MLVERVEGFAAAAEWRRAYEEINEFERMLIADGVRLVKLFLHITPDEQMRRFRNRLANPLKRWKLSYEDFRQPRPVEGLRDGDRGHDGEDLDAPRALASHPRQRQTLMVASRRCGSSPTA